MSEPFTTDRDQGDEDDPRCQETFDVHRCDLASGHEGHCESTLPLGTNGSYVSMVWNYHPAPVFVA